MPELPASARAWLAEFSSANTRDAYRRDLRGWLAYCAAEGVDPLAARRAHVTLWAQQMRESGLAPATVARKLAAVAGWYRWLVTDGEISRSPAEYVRRPRPTPVRDRRGPARDGLAALLAAAELEGPVAVALLRLLGAHGLRVSEACGIRVQDLLVVDGRPAARIVGKGGKVATVPLTPRTSAALAALGRQEGPLLGLDRHGAYRTVRRVAVAAGLPNVSPHSLRHSFATALLRSGRPLQEVQVALRHAQPATTMRYLDTRAQLAAAAVDAMDDLLADAS